MVESRIEPTKGSEFCRASTLCHLHLSVQRVCASADSSLMYEVLADQTMWAVCGKTAGMVLYIYSNNNFVLTIRKVWKKAIHGLKIFSITNNVCCLTTFKVKILRDIYFLLLFGPWLH